MARRLEEKERRRQERLAAERAAAQAAKRKKLVGFGAGGVLVVALVAVLAVVLLSGDDDEAPRAAGTPGAALPARQVSDLDEAARAAGCEVRSFPSEGRQHVSRAVDSYRTNPPTSGPHDPVPAQDGIYASGNAPEKEAWVHSLEHGRIILQYRPGTPAAQRAQLETLFNEPVKGADGYHMMLMENTTRMPYAVAAVSWTRVVGCKAINDRTWDALRAFRDQYVDKAPEFIP